MKHNKFVIIGSAFLVALTHILFMFKEASEEVYMYHNILMVVLGALIVFLSRGK